MLEDILVRSKVNKYTAKAVHKKEYIDKMYLLRNKALYDQILDQKIIKPWNSLLTEYTKGTK